MPRMLLWKWLAYDSEIYLIFLLTDNIYSQGGELTPSIYPFAMDTGGGFCNTAILFLKKIALVKFSNEPES